MTKDTHNYVISNMQMLEQLMNYLKILSYHVSNGGDFTSLPIVVNSNELKLSMLSFLLSGNFDNIIDFAPTNIKDDLVNNVEYYRRNTGTLNEDGKLLKVGLGLRIINKPARITDSDKVIKVIRDSIAHSKYELVGDDIHISNRGFEALLTVSWLESMTLTLFSNHADQSSKSGASDFLINYMIVDTRKICNDKDLKAVLGSLLKMTFTFNDKVSKYPIRMREVQEANQAFFGVISDKISEMRKEITDDTLYNKKALNIARKLLDHKKQELNDVYDYKLERLELDFIKEFDSVKNLMYGFVNVYALTQIIPDKYATHYDAEKRNVIAYKKVQEIIAALMDNVIGVFPLFERDYQLLFYLDMCYEFVFKAYMNLVFNYAKEQASMPYDFAGSNIKIILPNYVSIRLEEIKKLNILLLTSKGQQVIDITNKINRLNTEISDYKNSNLDYNTIYTEKMRNSLTHNNVKFKLVHNEMIVTFEDISDDVLNFKATGSLEDFIALAQDYINQINNNKKIV